MRTRKPTAVTTEPATPPATHVTEAELALMQSLHAEALDAQRMFNRCVNGLGVKYGLQQGDTLDVKTGAILRGRHKHG